MKTSSIIKYAIGGLLVCTSVSGIWGWLTTDKLVDEMKQKMTELERQEKRSAVLKSISNQMEEITYQQMKLSDEQRLEAIEQRELAEQERRNAVLAQQKALASEHKAIDAFEQAQYQRIQADLQRQQAEYSKSVADTLSFLALGRSLGAQATTQFYAGNRELAAMLSDLAYEYTKRYHGDMYYPAIYQAIALSSQSSNNWPKHQGPITDLDFMPNTDDLLVSVSSYGEIMMHQKNGRNLRTMELLKDSKYDFRDVYVNPKNGHFYALSRNSYMAVKAGKKITMIPLETIRHPIKIQQLEKSTDLLIIGEKQLALFDTKTNTVKETRNLDFNVTFTNRFDYKPIIFDDQGRMHIVESINKIITKKTPVKGRVTAFASSKGSGLQAYGMSDGMLYVIDKNGKVRTLVGHRSRISFIKINFNHVYSSSYDGTVNLWNISGEKIEPMTLVNQGNWILCFTFDPSKEHMWIGDQRGNLSEVLISVPKIIENVKAQVKRNFTPTEWNYYIGENVEYEPIVKTGRKEERP